MDLLYANDRPGEYPPSFYAETRDPAPDRPPLAGEVQADIAVIGGGYAGLSAALHLARGGRKVALLEAHRAGFGASGRNGGQIGSGQRMDVAAMEKAFGKAAARRLWDMAEDAKALTLALADEAGVPFGRGIATACRHDSERRETHENAALLARDYDYDQVEAFDHEGLFQLIPSPAFKGGVVDWGGAHIHPLNLALGMARLAEGAGAIIHEASHVTGIEHGKAGQKSRVMTAQGTVICDHVVIAANGYLGQLDRRMARKVMPINNFILATEPLGDRRAEVLPRDIAAFDTQFVVNYWRLSADGRLLFGGGENLGYRFPRDIAGMVRKAMLGVYPQLADIGITHAWGGTLAITRNRMPCFLRPGPNALAAGGFSGHGVAMATLAGRLMADAVMGQQDGFDTMAALPIPAFPGGPALRWPLLVAGMSWFSLRDRLGI